MGCFSQDAPPPVNYAQQASDTLQAQINLAPQQYAAEAQYEPKYTDLALSNITKLLNGSPGGPTNVTKSNTAGNTGWYDAQGNFVSPGELQVTPMGARDPLSAALLQSQPMYVPGNTPGAGDTWQSAGAKFDTTSTVNQPAQAGLTSVLASANTAQRAADISDVQTLGPQARLAMLNANPDQAALLASLNSQANSELAAGSNLTPDQIRAMQQASRAAFAARGLSGSNTGISDELLRQFNLGQQLLQQRQSFAQSVLGNNQAVIGDPFQQILGRSSGAVGQAGQIASSSGPTLFNPDDPLSAAITAGNQQNAAAFAAPSVLSDVGNVAGIAGKLVGGVASGFV